MVAIFSYVLPAVELLPVSEVSRKFTQWAVIESCLGTLLQLCAWTGRNFPTTLIVFDGIPCILPHSAIYCVFKTMLHIAGR